MDYAIQKAVELGINRITPLLTERCVVQLDSKREAKRLQHWAGIIQSACEQCGRAVLPELDTVIEYASFLSEPLDAQRLILDPEGGFSKAERELAYQHDAIGVQLGPRILRTETAVVASLSAMQTLWGDLDRITS